MCETDVLVNLTETELSDSTVDWATYPYSVITLTDLGLSRRISADEKLNTRCGSDDYVAPEVIIGMPYDGRATDAWSLGVLLYALLEGRLPFDPPSNLVHTDGRMPKVRSKTSHRIARVDWRWILYGKDGNDDDDDEDGHMGDATKFDKAHLTGARVIVEGLLRKHKRRWTIHKLSEYDWVKGGVDVPGGIKFREEVEGEEVVDEPLTQGNG